MKKIIVASILSLMLLGVGSANADGDDYTWYFDELSEHENTPMEDCIEARRDGITVQEYRNKEVGSGYQYGSPYEAHFINKDRMYIFTVTYNADTSVPRTMYCHSIEPE